MYQEHFGNNIYQQKNDVAIGSILIFMVHLGRMLMPELKKFMKPWKR